MRLQALIVAILASTIVSFTQVNSYGETLDWPQWRGPTRDGAIKKGSPWPESIAKKALRQVWRKEIGKGYPGPVLSEEMVFTVESTKSKNELVRAFKRKSGDEVWKSDWKGSMRVPFFAWKNGSWVRSTPAFDGENLYVGGMRDFLVCLDAKTGEKRWSVDFMKRYDSPLPSFGFVCSPLVEGDHLYVQAGSGFVKLEKSSGKSIWRALSDKGGMYGSAFSSPTVAKVVGKKQLLVQSRTTLAGIDPEKGKVLWQQPVKAFRGMNILTPTFYKNGIFTSSYGGKSLLFELSNNDQGFKIGEKWQNRQEGYMSGPIVIGDYCYMHLRKQRMTCLDMRNGDTKWISEKSFGKYVSMVTNGKEILALDEDGTLYLIKASPKKLIIKEEREISADPSWAHLAIAGKQLFVRELEAIACYEW